VSVHVTTKAPQSHIYAKWLGHANPAITARIYAHSQDEALAAAAASLGAVVTSGGVLRDL
jgi:integrase